MGVVDCTLRMWGAELNLGAQIEDANHVVAQAVAVDLADCRNVNAFDRFLVAGEGGACAGEDVF